MLIRLIFLSLLHTSELILLDLATCHDDVTLKLPDGMLEHNTFTWLGFVQYIQVTTGLPHQSKAPRIVLVHKQFGIGTATDLLHLPKNYKLGNVIFGDYPREEDVCGLTKSQLKMGMRCPRAYLEIPIQDVIPHPEFTRFGVGNSLAIVKFIRHVESEYMVPVCLPSEMGRDALHKAKQVVLIDYISTVPKDLDSEKLAKKTLKLFTHMECRRHRMESRLGSEGITNVFCTSGCGVRMGAPIIDHTPMGTFELVGIAAGGAPCRSRNSRRRLNPQPPLYIDVYPYTQWITNVVTAHVLPMPYPDNYQLTADGGVVVQPKNETKKRESKLFQESVAKGWRARTYVSGVKCYLRTKKFRKLNNFYSEVFEVNADPPAMITINMRIIFGPDVRVECVKMRLPNRYTRPDIRGVRTFNISIQFSTEWFPYTYTFSIDVFGRHPNYGLITTFPKWYKTDEFFFHEKYKKSMEAYRPEVVKEHWPPTYELPHWSAQEINKLYDPNYNGTW